MKFIFFSKIKLSEFRQLKISNEKYQPVSLGEYLFIMRKRKKNMQYSRNCLALIDHVKLILFQVGSCSQQQGFPSQIKQIVGHIFQFNHFSYNSFNSLIKFDMKFRHKNLHCFINTKRGMEKIKRFTVHSFNLFYFFFLSATALLKKCLKL